MVTGRTADNSSFRKVQKTESILTGINTYMYEIMAMPMKESFMNSIQKRKRYMRNSIREYNRTRDRSKTKSRTYEFKARQSKYMSQFEKSRDESAALQDTDSIFDNIPGNVKFKVSTSVDTTSRFQNGVGNSFNFKHLPKNVKTHMHNKVTEVLNKQKERVRNKPNDRFMLSKDGRNEIAQRIMKKLKDWPENDNMFGSTFKKFYWTKDYSH